MKNQTTVFTRPSTIDGRHFSVLIIGAGINGAGVFRDLCLQSTDCLIVDKADFSSGASGAPSRMIHGGLRYLENGEFSLVAESTRERNLLLKNANHLVFPLKTVVPLTSLFGGLIGSALKFFGRTQPSRSRGLFAVAIGLRVYDWLGRKQRVMEQHRIGRVRQQDRDVFSSNINWTATYFDAWISHPERLVMELIEDGALDQSKSAAINYCQVVGCVGNRITLKDVETGEFAVVSADAIVNSAGAWLDSASESISGPIGRVNGTKGSHLVLDHPELHRALDQRMVYFETNDGRICIVYPFMERVLVGSTDIPEDNPDSVKTDSEEIDYLLQVLGDLFPKMGFGRQNIVYTYVGVRPLARSNSKSPGQISRDHSVVVDEPNHHRSIPIVSLIGGKWTTFRALAETATDEVINILGKTRVRSTRTCHIGGSFEESNGRSNKCNMLPKQMLAGPNISESRIEELVLRYGTRAVALGRLFLADGDVPLVHLPSYSRSEIEYLCKQTGVQHLSDLILRRTLIAIRGHLNAASLNELANIAALAMNWSEARRNAEHRAMVEILTVDHNARVPGLLKGTLKDLGTADQGN